ncbi:uncharacterized protein RAG0_05240 [Rhynchosporium agropyri]|uniref:Uncharacterized protein n=1 Tax=Rhynchosporium agropyri TaxID=914238 RepID=A0A1E1KFV8_9HELO|nr:uncharacterized protein RAG0_05240 [Rhynchosporium agropyri]
MKNSSTRLAGCFANASRHFEVGSARDQGTIKPLDGGLLANSAALSRLMQEETLSLNMYALVGVGRILTNFYTVEWSESILKSAVMILPYGLLLLLQSYPETAFCMVSNIKLRKFHRLSTRLS